jgi:Ca2+-binding RTX toxin-like protein
VDTNFSIRRLGAGSVGLWAPTSRAVVYKPEGARHLYVSRPEGGTTRIPNASQPSWSTDGNRLAFQRGRSIVVARPDGTGAREIAKGSAPSFSPKGVIAYASLGCGARQGIHVVLPTGRGDHRVTTACTIIGDHANNTIYGGPERQSVPAGHGNDLVRGDGGNDVLDAGPGDDVVNGGAGRDILVGGAGVDRLAGGPGPDLIRARDSWRDSITCGSARDTVEADAIDIVSADCDLPRAQQP